MSSIVAPTGRDAVLDGPARIRAAFAAAAAEDRAAFMPYAVAGYPDAATSIDIALTVIDGGADLLELGLPYSDPVADGPTMQRANSIALAHGASLDASIEFVARVHAARPETPLVAMGYVNQVIGGRGRDSVLARLGEAGASGVIMADLTPDEGEELEAEAALHGLGIVYLVAPTTPPERQRFVTSRSQGFIYAVPLAGVTGARERLAPGVARYLRHVKEVSPVPVAVGFGISRPAQVRTLAQLADGVIVASALVDALGPDGRDLERMSALVRSLAAATARA